MHVIDDPGAATFRVNRETMVSPGILELERQKIFDRAWVYVGHESEVPEPGDFKTRDVCGRPLILCRDQSGQVRVLLNTCRHRGALVCREREGNARFFRCFYHAWMYDNAGQLVALPGEESYGEMFSKEELSLLAPPQVDAYQGFVFATFDADAEDLVSYLAGATEFIDLVVDQAEAGLEIIRGTHEYATRANWKLLVENSIDGYHGVPTHSTYLDYLFGEMKRVSGAASKASKASKASNEGFGRAYDLGNGHTAIEYAAPWARPVARWAPPFSESLRSVIDERLRTLTAEHGEKRALRIAKRSRNLFVFPNLVINDIMAITVRTFWPLSPDYMNVSAWSIGPIDEIDEFRSARLENFLTFLGPGGFATPDDVEALECCQKGFATSGEVEWSDVSRGMNSKEPRHDEEFQMRVFWRKWNEMVTA